MQRMERNSLARQSEDGCCWQAADTGAVYVSVYYIGCRDHARIHQLTLRPDCVSMYLECAQLEPEQRLCYWLLRTGAIQHATTDR